MTMQQHERLALDGQNYPLLDRPLQQCSDPEVSAKVEAIVKDKRMHNTSLRRNYLGLWSVRDHSLYLDDVQVLCEEHLASVASTSPQRGLRWLFP
jgi:hypothetical protein